MRITINSGIFRLCTNLYGGSFMSNFFKTEHIINEWKVLSIPPCTESPMKNHGGNEIAVDYKNKIFYAWEIFVVMHGIDTIVKSCEKHLNRYPLNLQSN